MSPAPASGSEVLSGRRPVADPPSGAARPPFGGPSPGPPEKAPPPPGAHDAKRPAVRRAQAAHSGGTAVTASLEQLRRCHFAVDLGAARTRVYVKGAGLVVDQPSVAAVNTRTGALIAVGEFAEKMTGRTPDYIRVVRPVTGGTVVDIEMAQRMLRQLIGDRTRRALRRRPRLRAAACTPHDADPLAQRAAIETLVGLGARRVELVDTLIAAAVGCGLPVERPEATMIMVCGAAATQVAVLSLGSIVRAERIPVGGEAVDAAIVQHLRHQHELMLPSQSVRPLQLALEGNGLTPQGPEVTEIHGRDVATGLARSVKVDTAAVRRAIQTPLTAVLDGIGKVLRDCPPDLVADLADRGIMMVGGSALLPGLDQMLRQATGMPVHIAEQPELCAVEGLGAMLEGRIAPMVLDPLGA
nr:rod shape-determining protein [Actinospica acidiphila]